MNTVTLDDFRRAAADHVTQLRTTGRPLEVTLADGSMIVVQDGDSYHRLSELARHAEAAATVAAVRVALDDVAAGRIRPADEVLRELATRYGLSDDT